MIDIVIINWNSGNLLRVCIDSIIHNKNIIYVRNIFVLDNNSCDNSIALIPTHNKVKIIKNNQNLGFAKAANQGFHKCTEEYILLLNPDTKLFNDTLCKCYQFMEQNKQIDILGCQLLNNDGSIAPSCSRFPTPIRFLTDAMGLAKLFPKLFKPALIMEDWDHKTSRFVDQIMGAFMFLRRDLFEKVGYFDERFFVYFEELDFSKRFSELGGRSFFNSDIKIIHSGAGTTQSVKSYRLFLNLSSRLKYGKKHFSFIGYCILWISTTLIEPVPRIILGWWRYGSQEVKEILNGYRLLFRK